MTQHYVLLNPDGTRAFFDDDAYALAGAVDAEGNPDPRPTLPPGCVAIDDETWDSWISNPNQQLVGGSLQPTAPPVAPPPTVLSAPAYLDRFTAAETDAVAAAALAQPSTPASRVVFTGLLRLAAGGTVDLRSTGVAAWHEALLAANLLTQARSTAILTP